MQFPITGQEKDDLLMPVTAWTGLMLHISTLILNDIPLNIRYGWKMFFVSFFGKFNN